MLLTIQRDESLRSFVERNLYLSWKQPLDRIFKKYPKACPTSRDVIQLASMLGWEGCYGFNRMLHYHTDYPLKAVFKNVQDISYSGQDYLGFGSCIGSNRIESGFCPICVREDMSVLGFSYWRRSHCTDLKVCAKHNVVLNKSCPLCAKRFSFGGHDLDVMWKTCNGYHFSQIKAVQNTDPTELKKSQMYEQIQSFSHHISEEAALAALLKNVNLHDTLKHEAKRGSERSLGEYIEWRLGIILAFRSENRLPPEESTEFIFQVLVRAFPDFSSFVSELRHDAANFRPIDSLWSTYRAGSQESTHYVEEDYDSGVGIWSCPYPAKVSHGMWNLRPTSYPCCNFAPAKKKGRPLQPERVAAAPPKIDVRARVLTNSLKLDNATYDLNWCR